MSRKSKVDFKQLATVIVGSIGAVAVTKLLRDNTKTYIKDDKIRGLVAPAAVIGGAIFFGIKNPKMALIVTAATAGAGIMAAGGVLDYMDRTKTKNDILGLAGDNEGDDQVIYLNGADELLEYAVASMPQQEQKRIPEQPETVYIPVETSAAQGDEEFEEGALSLQGDEVLEEAI